MHHHGCIYFVNSFFHTKVCKRSCQWQVRCIYPGKENIHDYRKWKEINLTEDTTVAEYLEQNQYQVKRIAVELNGDILPKYSYSDTMLKDGDRLEVVTFVGGG